MTTATLAELAEINPKADRLAADTPVSFVGMAEMDAASAEALPRETRPYDEVAKGYTPFRNGDILVAKITGCWENNKTGVARLANSHGAGSTEFHVVRPRAGAEVRFLLHFLRQPSVTAAGKSRMTGSAGQKRVPASFLEGLTLSLPPVEEQRRIAAILDRAAAIRTKRRQVLAQLDALTRSTFNEMFGAVPAALELADVVESFRYGTSNKSGESGLPTLRIPNVIGSSIDTTEIKTVEVTVAERERLALRDGDLLFVRTNGNPDNVGRSAVFSQDAVARAGFAGEPWIYASYLIRARLYGDFEPIFIAAYLRTSEGRRQLRELSKTSAGQYNINTAALASILVPSVSLRQQKQFAARVGAINVQRALLEHAVTADEELFASLQSRAFRGEL